MAAELSDHLGYERGQAPPGGVGDARNGTTAKTIHTGHGSVRIEQPRDRKGVFEPRIVQKHQRRFDGFDDEIIAMYGRGMSVRDIQAHLAELYEVEVGHDLISRVTDAVLDDVREWQARPLEDVYPCLFLDALIVTVRDGGAVRNKACYVAMASTLRACGTCSGFGSNARRGQVLACCAQRAQAARRLRRLNLLRRQAQGFPEAIEAVCP
jgi:putative transposase